MTTFNKCIWKSHPGKWETAFCGVGSLPIKKASFQSHFIKESVIPEYDAITDLFLLVNMLKFNMKSVAFRNDVPT